MDSSGEDRDGWHYWSFGGVFYARRLKTSPPVVVAGSDEDERDAKIAAYLEHGWKGLDK
jgi:hypothetical protein